MNETQQEWSTARFPSRHLCEEFLDQIRLWNKVEGLPAVDVKPNPDGLRVRFHVADDDRGVRRLVDCYGGYVKSAALERALAS